MAADAVSHEHRSVLLTPEDRPELPGPEEVAEALVDLWGMTLNIDVERNLDDDGRDLGVTGWRCLVRVEPQPGTDETEESGPSERDGEPTAASQAEPKTSNARPRVRYAEAILAAGCWREAEDLAIQAVEKLPDGPRGVSLADEFGPRLVSADRLWRHELAAMLAGPGDHSAAQAASAPGRPESHAARSPEPPGALVTPPADFPPGPTHPDDFEDPHPPEPPEIAGLLDEALANDAPGRILASRWLE
jgi:hypothetical protein